MSSQQTAPAHIPPWLRGPVDGVPTELQAVAQALIQTQEEVEGFTAGLPDELLWMRPAGLGHAAFHLRHIAGVIDRLFTTARGESISDAQREAALRERSERDEATTAELVELVRARVASAIDQLRGTDVGKLYEARLVGGKQLPSNVYGLLFHAAEHAQRHCGQLLVTTRVVRERA